MGTDNIEENKLGLTTFEAVNSAEADGLAKAVAYLIDLDGSTPFTPELIKTLHKNTFEHLYEWAGKYRRTNVQIGTLTPPDYSQLPTLMAQYCNEVQYKIENIKTRKDLIHCIAYTHSRFIEIHPFVNGNGRTARLITDFVALQQGENYIVLYHREKGEQREKYIKALVSAQQQKNYSELEKLIEEELNKKGE